MSKVTGRVQPSYVDAELGFTLKAIWRVEAGSAKAIPDRLEIGVSKCDYQFLISGRFFAGLVYCQGITIIAARSFVCGVRGGR